MNKDINKITYLTKLPTNLLIFTLNIQLKLSNSIILSQKIIIINTRL